MNTAEIPEKLAGLIDAAIALEKYPLARLVSLYERNDDEGRRLRHMASAYLAAKSDKKAHIAGWTGTPGAGKSTLSGRICLEMLKENPDISIAVLAIDPSSHKSGGALLGDRTRTRFPSSEKRIYFRSQASNLELGGIGRQTYSVVRLLSRLFDIVLIETVGIGQSEIDIRHAADTIFLVLQPFAGDQIQFMKAGIMEIPDVFIVNKSDEEKQAAKSFYQLQTSLEFTGNVQGGELPPIFMTSSVSGRGIAELTSYILESAARKPDQHRLTARYNYFLEKSLRQRYGELGMNILQKEGFDFDRQAIYEELESEAVSLIESGLKAYSGN